MDNKEKAGPKNGQGGDICGEGGGECTCEGCTAENAFPCDSEIAAGDIFVDACNKIMYIAGEGGFPANGIPFGPEDRPCPPEEPCPDCPDCPQPETCGTCLAPKDGEALLPSDWCKCSGALATLFGLIANNNCVCQHGGALPKCPQPCLKEDGSTPFPDKYWYQDSKKECPCNDDGDEAKCPNQCPSDAKSDWYQNAAKECPCEEGQEDLGCQTKCASGSAKICPEDCPKCPDCPECPPCNSCCPPGGTGAQTSNCGCTIMYPKFGTLTYFEGPDLDGCNTGQFISAKISSSVYCKNDLGNDCFSGAFPKQYGPFNVQELLTCEEVNNEGHTCTSCDLGCVYCTSETQSPSQDGVGLYTKMYISSLLPERVSLNCDGTACGGSGVGPIIGGDI